MSSFDDHEVDEEDESADGGGEAGAAALPPTSRIVLIGSMGAGKTSLARHWARSIPSPAFWFDSDRAALIELGATSVAEVFRTRGERVWRDAERAVVSRRAGTMRRGVEVWSLGAGAVLDDEVQRAIFDATVIWLDAPVDVLWQRATDDGDRPLATSRDEFVVRHEVRSDIYQALSQVRLDTNAPLDEVELPRTLAEHVDIDVLCSGLVTGSGLLDRIEDLAITIDRDILVVGDAAAGNVLDLIDERLHAAGARVLDRQRLAMGEWRKQLSTAEQIVQQWASVGAHRGCVVVAAGGGTLLDVAGFAASIYQRGLDWVSIPTTLTAQVDAGIGGKTAVNLGSAKNVVGTVHIPVTTVIDPAALSTLPALHVADGFVEAAKTALLAGEHLAARARSLAGRAPEPADPDWIDLIDACAAFKDAVVSEDPLDVDGVRAQLNLGHTLGHAVEAASSGAVTHGRAVAIGIHAALRMSVARLEADDAIVEWWLDVCGRAGIATTSPFAWSDVQPWLQMDKKRGRDGLRWVLLRRMGTPVTDVLLEESFVQQIWEHHIHRTADSGGDLNAGTPAPAESPRRVLVLFGVNLDRLGQRDAEHYGTQTLAQLVEQIEQWAGELGLIVECRQTNSVERFIAAIHEARNHDAIIVNPGAWTHYERSLHDALEPVDARVVEVHLSDVDSREPWRQESVIADVADHRISGRGADGYRDALAWVREQPQSLG